MSDATTTLEPYDDDIAALLRETRINAHSAVTALADLVMTERQHNLQLNEAIKEIGSLVSNTRTSADHADNYATALIANLHTRP